MSKKASDSVCVYGARVVARHLDAMKAEVDGVIEASDEEYIHRMRVASRRMRSTLGVFRDCFGKKEYRVLIKDVRDVTRALGEARDLDVQLLALKEVIPEFSSTWHAPGMKRLLMRMEQKRQEAQTHVIAAMQELDYDKVFNKLEEWANPLLARKDQIYLYSPELYQLGFNSIQQKINDLLAHVRFIYDPENVTELHNMRISAKRLRYTLEAFDDLYQGQLKPFHNTARKLQDMLGFIHDLDVWIAMIPNFIEEERTRIVTYFGHDRGLRRLLPGLEAFRKSRVSLRQAQYEDFLKEWQKLEKDAVWEKLLKLLNMPFDLNKALKAVAEERESSEEPSKEETGGEG